MAKAGGMATAAKKFSDGIKPVEDVSPYLKLGAYGRNGSGKTRLGASFPNALIIDINEEGSRSAVGTGSEVRECRSFDEVVHGYWYLKAGNHDYEAVVVDTTTALHQASLRKVLGEAEDRDPTREPSTPDKRTHGRAGSLTSGLILDFRNLQMHVVFLCQERVIDDEDTDEPAFHTADLPASVRGVLLGSVGIIGRTFNREVVVRNRTTKKKSKKWIDLMLVGPHEQYDTKDRTNNLGMLVQQPTGPKLIAAWENRGDQ